MSTNYFLDPVRTNYFLDVENCASREIPWWNHPKRSERTTCETWKRAIDNSLDKCGKCYKGESTCCFDDYIKWVESCKCCGDGFEN